MSSETKQQAFVRINDSRVWSINHILGVIAKSAKSNGIKPHELRDYLQPVSTCLLHTTGKVPEAGPAPAPEPAAAPTAGTHKAPRWQDMRAVVAGATEQELIDVLSIISVRLDDLKHERGN